jgi:hypothetical protein
MHANTLTLATLLASTTLITALPDAHAEAFHGLLSRQSSSNSNLNQCRSEFRAGCLSSPVVESACKSAICGTACLSVITNLAQCCKDAPDLTSLSPCIVELGQAGNLSTVPATLTNAPQTNSPAAASPTSKSQSGGVDHLVAAGGQLGLAGSVFAWALGFLLL